MAAIYNRFGNQSPSRIRDLIVGSPSAEEAPTPISEGLMSRASQPTASISSRFSGRSKPATIPQTDTEDSGPSFLESFFFLLGNASDDREAVANAVAPMKGEPAIDLSEWENMPPAPGRESPTRQALGTVPSVPTTSTTANPLLDFIASGEGDYNSSNRGTSGNKIVGSTNNTVRDGRPLTEMTIGQIQELQSIRNPSNPNRLFAVGRYQAIPDTLNQAVRELGLSEGTVFNQDTQDMIGMWLINEKRPTVGAFLRGEDVSVDDAMMSLAREFASVPVPRDTRDPRGRRVRAGQSFYHHYGGNRAGHSIEETRNILLTGRGNFNAEEPASALTPLSSLVPQPNPRR